MILHHGKIAEISKPHEKRKALATGARHHEKSVSRLPSAETRWRACEEAFAAAAGPKRREALATGARHQKLDSVLIKKLADWRVRSCVYTSYLLIFTTS
jgi:hypothetical protein